MKNHKDSCKLCESKKPHPDKRAFRTSHDLRLFLANVIRQVESGNMTESRGKSLGYLTQILTNIIRDDELISRIEALEKKINKGE